MSDINTKISYERLGPEAIGDISPIEFGSVSFSGETPANDIYMSFVHPRAEYLTKPQPPLIGIGTIATRGALEDQLGIGIPQIALEEFTKKVRDFTGGSIIVDPVDGPVRNGKDYPMIFGYGGPIDGPESHPLFMQINVSDNVKPPKGTRVFWTEGTFKNGGKGPVKVKKSLSEEFRQINGRITRLDRIIPGLRKKDGRRTAMELVPFNISSLMSELIRKSLLQNVRINHLATSDTYTLYK